ncbi:hypothetical protein YC2023_083350 [Brassica napus]
MEASKLDGKRGGFRRFIAMNTAGLITGYVDCGNGDLQGYKTETTKDTGVAADSHLACTHTQAVCDYCLSNNQEETTNIALVTKGDDTHEPFDLDLSPPPPPPHNFHRLSNHRSKPDVDDIKKLPQPNSPIHPGVHLPYYVTPHGCATPSLVLTRVPCALSFKESTVITGSSRLFPLLRRRLIQEENQKRKKEKPSLNTYSY